ncbi:phosphoribosylanthranilate isomerase [Rhodovibrio salinarum]|uniref:N-(5'-phosphoribosyl)anthranilate isomerase n=1 Tax=Rhodovibrio salinarum TaxID=1087 RepID=A0A934QIL6_9PROT|nr:phosphoribosylanthranilate isomerase [Rhodovibrio salinarum]MBK1697235.1 phosphoribosylanthranilate isomerase [Rhodovibrio salinarum]
MSVATKICGLTDADSMAAAAQAGAAYVGFIFYPPSPRYVTPQQAAALAAHAGQAVKVAVTVDLSDDELGAILETAPVDLIQLHGAETPQRVAEVRARFAKPVMKSIPVAGPDDLDRADSYAPIVDRLLFDAKPPKEKPDALPGGNALSFDWQLLAGRSWSVPWMLSGGLTVDNLAEAVEISRARAIDVSSGVEDAPGRKNPEKIRTLLAAAARLRPVA